MLGVLILIKLNKNEEKRRKGSVYNMENLTLVDSGNYQKKREYIQGQSRVDLENFILDKHYNDFLSDNCDGDNDKLHYGKRVPYLGWFWRTINFSDLSQIPIGKGPNFIGFMANNKWYYDERFLTIDEAKHVIALIDSAISEYHAGGLVDNQIRKSYDKLEELWDYMQTLTI